MKYQTKTNLANETTETLITPQEAVIEEDGLNVIQATAMTIVTIIAVTLGTIYGSIL